jgi:hypothetical protein
MSDECRLQAANGVFAHCDEERCTFWRVVDHLDVEIPRAAQGCAVQHFELLGGEGSEIARWLLSVKQRIEGAAEDDLPG